MTSSPLTLRVNAYLATLILTVAGAGAALLIIRVATASQFSVLQSSAQMQYATMLPVSERASATSSAPSGARR